MRRKHHNHQPGDFGAMPAKHIMIPGESKSFPKQRGFTLVEILLTVVIIGILLAMALPNFLTSRNTAQTKTCLTNLQHITHAKEQLAAEQKLNNGDTVAWANLVTDFLKVQPACPANGDYTIGVIGATPQCSVSGHALP